MKKTLIALSASLLALGAAAEGNNSVTLYGIADAYIGAESKYTLDDIVFGATTVSAHRERQAVVNSGGMNTSRIGLRINEDLGNGLSAFAGAEMGVNLDKGTAKGKQARRAVVGLAGGFGAVSAGRQTTSYENLLTGFEAQADSGFSAVGNGDQDLAHRLAGLRCFQGAGTCTQADVDMINSSGMAGQRGAFLGYTERYSNSLRYDSPNFNGFSGSVTLGLGENKSATEKATQGVSFAAKYENGPLAVGFAHQEDQAHGAGLGVVPAGARVKLRNSLVAGSYDFGVARLHAGYNQADYKVVGWDKQKEYFLGAVVPVDAFTLIGQVARSKGDTFGKTTSVGGEARYALSKRTTVYASGNRTKLDHYTNSMYGLGVRHAF